MARLLSGRRLPIGFVDSGGVGCRRRLLALLSCLSWHWTSAQLLLPDDWNSKLGAPSARSPAQVGAETLDVASAGQMENTSPEAIPESHVVGPHHFCSGGPEEQYSGTLPAAPGTSYFFWLVRSTRAPRASQVPTGAASGGAGNADANRENTPLVLWLSGGPGCSSTLGMMLENGPCRVDGTGDSGWRTHRNPWSWTDAAHVVWVDQPADVGFSEGPETVRNETGVARDMYTFLQNFFLRFPDLARVPFYIFGESYAGHYVPALAHKILQEARRGSEIAQLAGVALGNALVNPAPQFLSKPEMAHTGGPGGSLGAGVVDDDQFSEMKESAPACARAIHMCQVNRTESHCYDALYNCVAPLMQPVLNTGRNPYDLRRSCPAKDRPICYSTSTQTAFLNDPSTKKALGADPEKFWTPCDMQVLLPFALSGDYFARFDQDVAELLAAGLRVLVYNGDCDFMVDWIGSKRWVTELAWPRQQKWAATLDQSWNVNGKQRGVQRTYSGLTFLQLFGAGHLVPMDLPEVSLAMVQEFISPTSPWGVTEETEGAGLMSTLGVVLVLLAGNVGALHLFLLCCRALPKHLAREGLSSEVARGHYLPLSA